MTLHQISAVTRAWTTSLYHYKDIWDASQGEYNMPIISVHEFASSTYFLPSFLMCTHMLYQLSGFFTEYQNTISLSKVLFSDQTLIFHFNCSNSKAFKWETVSSGSLEHQVRSKHTQGCPLAQLTAFAALAVLVLCNSVQSVTSLTELGQKSAHHETTSWTLSKISTQISKMSK